MTCIRIPENQAMVNTVSFFVDDLIQVKYKHISTSLTLFHRLTTKSNVCIYNSKNSGIKNGIFKKLGKQNFLKGVYRKSFSCYHSEKKDLPSQANKGNPFAWRKQFGEADYKAG